MNIGIIDVDNYENMDQCFPNLALMKLSAYHKNKGDNVELYEPLLSGHKDIVYMSKVFSFTKDYPFQVDADKVIKGGSGYCISVKEGKEYFDKSKDIQLEEEIEHIYPDYSLYNITDKAYGFLTRGCPRACGFCHVAAKEGRCSIKVADLNEFYKDQKEIVLMDPNILACKDWKDLLQQLINSKAKIDFTQGLDIRLMTDEKAAMLKQMKIKTIHFAYDDYKDKKIIEPKLKLFRDITGYDRHQVTVYVLCGFNTTIEQDLERIYFLRDIGFSPYVMLYNKEAIPKGHVLRKLQRYVNMRATFYKVKDFYEYTK